MKKCISILICLSFISSVIAAPFEVKNVRFEDEGETIVIHYDLSGDSDQKYRINVSLEDSKSRDFPIGRSTLSGDVGKNIGTGMQKKIVWKLTEDYPNGLIGEGFRFTVSAKLQKKKSSLPYIIVGAGVAGGAAVYFLTKKTTGSISVQVSDQY